MDKNEKKLNDHRVTLSYWVFVILFLILWLTVFYAKADLIIHNVSWSGSGCDFNSVSATVSPDQSELSVLFDDYRIEMTPQSPSPSRKDCIIELLVQSAPDEQFAFRSVDYRGFVSLPQGVEGYHRMAALLEGQRIPHLREARFVGPLQQNYLTSVTASRLQFSNCGQTWHRVFIYSQLGLTRLRGATQSQSAFVDLDSKDYSGRQGIGIEIKPCW